MHPSMVRVGRREDILRTLASKSLDKSAKLCARPGAAYAYAPPHPRNGRSSMATRFAEANFTAQEALQFHAQGKPGKLEITPTKPLATQRDLSLAYSPGVAVPVQAIAADPNAAFDYTARGNLVAVISNGTAILGLGDLGALASKPVMEGKAVL